MPHAVQTWFSYFFIIGSRYLILAGVAFLIWYIVLRKRIYFNKIQLRFPSVKDYQREIFFSLFTMFLFSFVAWFFLGQQEIRKHTLFYKDIDQYSQLYFWLAFPLSLLVHDTYFYWIHRLMHHPKLFRVFHLIHHKSTNPSPWAAFSFHPLEGILEVGVLVLILYIMPLTKFHLLFFFLFQMFYNVYGHLGWELFPKNFQRTWIGRWINTSVTHNQHHQYFTGNYGLYFLFWDRLMGTMREDYEAKYDEVKGRTKSLKEGKE
nr:sterol desaturase family protein [uncultured Lacibacter sp.]